MQVTEFGSSTVLFVRTPILRFFCQTLGNQTFFELVALDGLNILLTILPQFAGQGLQQLL